MKITANRIGRFKMSKHYSEQEVMKYQRTTGGIHTKESRAMIRAWADERGLTYNTRGQFPEKLFMMWIDEHVGQSVEVVASRSIRITYGQRKGEIVRLIDIRCNFCAEIHGHGSLNLGVREDEGHRVVHCSGPYAPGFKEYHIIDNTPVEDWELRAVEHNENLRKQKAAFEEHLKTL